jgi:Rieske 2Fe-2S family protein
LKTTRAARYAQSTVQAADGAQARTPELMTTSIKRALAARQAGHALPQALYTDPAVHEFDLQAIYYRHWIQAGLESQIPRPGDYLTMTVGKSPIVILRDTAGEISAFFNTCRHRGAQICSEPRGHARRLVCPYHRWTYDLKGQLLKATRMPEDFRVGDYRLRPVHVESLAGLIFVCLSEDPPAFAPFRQALEPLLEPHDLRRAKVAHSVTLIERADWKLVMENARECYHCPTSHPQLMRTLGEVAASEVRPSQPVLEAYEAHCRSRGLKIGWVTGLWFEIERFPLAEGAVSYTMDGKPAVRKTLGKVGDGDVGVLWWALQPNGFTHLVGDYGFSFQVFPTGPQETTVTGTWIVNEAAVEGVDYDLARLIEVWAATNLQDRALAENNQRGVNSLAYVPGPYSPVAEPTLRRFTDWYCAAATAFFSEKRGHKNHEAAKRAQ